MEFQVYRLVNPATDCEYSYLAVPADGSALLSLGSETLCFDMQLPPEEERWLRDDFAPTDEVITLDFAGLRYLLDLTFAGGVAFGIVLFDEQLKLRSIELSLEAQEQAEEGPEYLVRDDDTFERLYREQDRRVRVSPAEATLLNACAAMFRTLAAEKPHLLLALPPPRFRELGKKLPLLM
ncbi:MAG: hypothetical protein U1A78_02410 [Polyangia bacterium]